MISRNGALNVLYEVLDADVLNDRLQKGLSQIADAIEYEEHDQVHVWGLPEEQMNYLVVSHVDDGSKESEKWFAKGKEVYESVKYTPSQFERDNEDEKTSIFEQCN